MNRPKCAVINCENGALVAYGNKWICGECFMKIRSKQLEQQNKEIEDIGNGN